MQGSTGDVGSRTASNRNVEAQDELDRGAIQRSTSEPLQGVHFTTSEAEDLVNILRGQDLSDDEIARLEEKVADLVEDGGQEQFRRGGFELARKLGECTAQQKEAVYEATRMAWQRNSGERISRKVLEEVGLVSAGAD